MTPLTVADVLGPGGVLAGALPGYEHRPAQIELAEAVLTVLRSGETGRPGILLGDAGTGTGKSAAYLVPALLAGLKITVSVSVKALQDQLNDKDLPFLAEHLGAALGRPLRHPDGTPNEHAVTWQVLKGRGNYACKRAVRELDALPPERRAFATPGAGADWERFREWYAGTPDGDLERLAPALPPGSRPFDPGLLAAVTVTEDECPGRSCALYEACFTTRARQQAAQADVLIANHALVLIDRQLRYRTGGKVGVMPAKDALVADEAHDLPEVARSVLGEALAFSYGRTLAARLPRQPFGCRRDAMAAAPLAQALEAWEDDLRERFAVQDRRAGRTGGGSAGDQLLLGDERAWAAPVVAAAEALARRCAARGEAVYQAWVDAERGHPWVIVADGQVIASGGEDPDAAPEEADARVWQRRGLLLEQFAAVAMAVATPLGDTPGEDADAFVRLAERTARSGSGAQGRPGRLVGRYIPVDVSAALRLYVWDFDPPGAQGPSLRQDPDDDSEADEARDAQRRTPVVATSATLTAAAGAGRFAYFRREAGVPPHTPQRPVSELVVPSPFPYRQNARLYVPPRGRLDAEKRSEPERYHDQLAEEMLALVRISDGRAFLLFTSRASLRAVHARLAPRLPGHWRVLVQGEDSRQEVVGAFRDPARVAVAPPVLFATRSYFQGVDIQGAGLSLVVLDKLPFPVPDDPLYAARARMIGRAVGDPQWGHFRHLTLPMVVQLTAQAVGRLIRSATDVGIAAVLDRRLLEKSYGGGVLRALPPIPLTQSLRDAAAFFLAHQPKGSNP